MKNLIGILIATLLISGMALADTKTIDPASNGLLDWTASVGTIHADNYTDTTYTGGTGITLTGTVFSTTDGEIVHDNLSGFVANEHLDWTSDLGATNIHSGNYTDTNTTYTAGRSLTLDGTTINADAELYTDQTGTYIEDPVVESLNDLFLGFMSDITITYVKCKTDTGTVSINLEDGSDNNILSAELVCDAGGQTSCASGCDVNTINASYDNITAKTEDIDYDASATASSPTKISLMIGFTIDD